MDQKEYVGTCYIGVVGPSTEIGICRDSIEAIARRPGDTGPHAIRATKGYDARDGHLNNFYYRTKHDFCLMLDHDMTYQRNTLERLRQYKRPYMTGLYMRRTYAPVYSVWYQPGDEWPLQPFVEVPDQTKLYELGASGWGCILVHRDVLTAMLPILKGEPWIIEDDMDVWPYDLPGVMGTLAGLRELVDTKAKVPVLRPALSRITETLEAEIRPLRGSKSPVGSDLRFPWYARAAGFPLMGDPGVRCGHVTEYPVSPDDFDNTPAEKITEIQAKIMESLARERQAIADGLAKLGEVE